MIIIGITGTLGSGKGTIATHIASRFGFSHVEAREVILAKVRELKLPETRDNTRSVANDLRAQHGASFIVDTLYEQAAKTGTNTVIESIRALAEIDSLKSKGTFFLIAVDADPELRFERIKARGGGLDHVTFDEFMKHEELEMQSDDPAVQSLKDVAAKADVTIANNGTISELIENTDRALEKLGVTAE